MPLKPLIWVAETVWFSLKKVAFNGILMELRIDFSNKKVIVGIIALICVLALISFLPGIMDKLNPDTCTVNGVCLHEERLKLLNQLVPVFILAGILIGAVVFFFMTTKLENKKKELESITHALIRFLSKDEKAIVQKILENDGKIFQSEISRIEGIGKLKSHRILLRLSDRGVIEIEKHGKTNIIRLAKDIKQVLVK
ncbi:MAG: hypothetical protein ABH986_05795 [archaeon]